MTSLEFAGACLIAVLASLGMAHTIVAVRRNAHARRARARREAIQRRIWLNQIGQSVARPKPRGVPTLVVDNSRGDAA